MRADRASCEAQDAPVHHDHQVAGQRVLPVPQRARDHTRHARVALQSGRRRVLVAVDPVGGLQPRERRELHVVLAERRQHLVDVAEEDAVRADDEHPLGGEAPAVRIEEVGGSVQRDRGLAGAGAAVDDEDAPRRRPDRLVLLGLNGGDDVAHAAGPVPVERGEQRRLAEHGEVGRLGLLPVEDLVVDPDQLPAVAGLGEEVPAAHHRHRVAGGGPVEGLGHGGPPVDDEGGLVLLGDGDPPHVEGPSEPRRLVRLQVEPPEAEGRGADVEGGEPTPRQLLGRVPLQPGLVGPTGADLGVAVRDPAGGGAHDVEPLIGVVDVPLLGFQLGVRDGQRGANSVLLGDGGRPL
jgi:hypothetical protein